VDLKISELFYFSSLFFITKSSIAIPVIIPMTNPRNIINFLLGHIGCTSRVGGMIV
jgi:hypothetical protein